MTSPLQLAGIQSYWVQPGRFMAGEYPAPLGSLEETARLGALLESGIDSFVDLTRNGELPAYLDSLESLAAARQLHTTYRRFPVVDHGIPEHQQMKAILDHLDASLADGHNVYLHCWGGVGRTGMTVACFLIRHGLSGRQALEQLATWWRAVPKQILHPRSPETPEQIAFVLEWNEPHAEFGE